MNVRSDCYFCPIKTVQHFLCKYKPIQRVAEDFFSVHPLFIRNWDLSNPKLATEIHRIAKAKTHVTDLYKSEK